MLIKKDALQEDYPVLIELWQRSVAATHDFISREVLAEIRLELPRYFLQVDLQMWYDREELIGFSGTLDDRLEMLFLDPTVRNRGLGSQIISRLKDEAGIQQVSVNEANRQALHFYEKNGFIVSGRSEEDEQGRPYPVLHLSLNIGAEK